MIIMTSNNLLNIKNPQVVVDILKEIIAGKEYNKEILEDANSLLIKLEKFMEKANKK